MSVQFPRIPQAGEGWSRHESGAPTWLVRIIDVAEMLGVDGHDGQPMVVFDVVTYHVGGLRVAPLGWFLQMLDVKVGAAQEPRREPRFSFDREAGDWW